MRVSKDIDSWQTSLLHLIHQKQHRLWKDDAPGEQQRDESPVEPGHPKRRALHPATQLRPKLPARFYIPEGRKRALEQVANSSIVWLFHGSMPSLLRYLRRSRIDRKTRDLTVPMDVPSASAISW